MDSLTITIRDEDKKDAKIVRLLLSQVICNIAQRPSADNITFVMTMENLNIEGLKKSSSDFQPVIVKTRVHETRVLFNTNKLLTISFEANPPADPDGDLDTDGGSLVKKKIQG